MPKLWNQTIDAHRHAVRDAVLDAAAELVEGGGLRAVTMSQLAERAGIGRATLYKYFPDAEAVLAAWHERQITAHLAQLREAANRPGPAVQRLTGVLTAYADLAGQRHGGELAAHLHQSAHVGHAEQHLTHLIATLITEGADAGNFRRDVPPAELAAYCLHALTAATALTMPDARDRLVNVTLHGLRPVP
ncbi:helix-turn-helix domain containing protein [Streptomyces sp. HNM0663]|uniref:Helix-turn-helix domain containing protein n=1 Tax=Streptomyces chengmaiensis TaxID=3040919 RepID=A0ABT6HIA2_9ACTN|nr:helix-turn-helix domain containing protein [Streptomyces chengmaiensis]MDH2388484.1 helix-turn-helix domain containing protein [Streptomyces chengmaiensis]